MKVADRPSVTFEDRTTALLKKWLPRIAVGNLIIAVATHALKPPVAWPLYGLVILSFAIAFFVGMFHLSSARGARTPEQLGLKRASDWLGYDFGSRGIDPTVYVIAFAAFLVALFTGWVETPSGFLALATIFLMFSYVWIARRWPADIEGEL